MSKVSELKKWIKDELIDRRFNKFEDVVEIIADEGESNEVRTAYEFKFRFNIYTETHRYRISAIDRSEDDGYLGCTASVRKPRAGEDWNRGNDLADGPFNKKTWEKIKGDIIAYELVKLAPKVEPTAVEEKEAVASS